MRYQMPKIQDRNALLEGLSTRDREIVLTVIKPDGSLRASKPANRCAAYVWRMVAFMVSPKREHNCMPMMADLWINAEDYARRTDKYIPRNETAQDRDTVMRWDMEPDQRTWRMMHDGERRRKFIKEELDPIVDRLVDNFKKSDWNGVRRWARAFGQI